MLKGLEINIVTLNNSLKNLEFNGRIESEFFQTEYTKLLTILYKKPTKKLGQFAFITDGEHGNPKTFPTGYAKYYGARNVLEGILNDNNVDFITKEHHYTLRKSALKPNDLLISCVGANVGYAAIVPDNVGNANIVRNVALIRSNTEDISNHYLLAYFQSYFGKQLYFRLATGNAQPLVSLDYIKTIPVYCASNALQKQIISLIEKAKSNRYNANILADETTANLLSELNLDTWQPTEEAKTVKKFSKSYAISGRLDAEYYQPKFDELFAEIEKVKHKPLGSIASFKKSIEPGSDAYQTEGIPFIRVSDISKFGLSEPEIHLDREIYNDETLKPKKDTILLSKDGSVGIAYKVEQDLDVITSSALLHLTITDKEVLPDYLTLVLNSKLTQMQAERDAGGSIIQHWRPDEIKQVLIPILPMDTQKELVKQIQQSFKLRQESSKLIDIAKQAVEIAIEQDELTAMKFIKDNT